MFGIITHSFIEKIHYYFYNLRYSFENELDFNQFMKTCAITLSRTKDLEDTQCCIQMIHYCWKHWNSIERIFKKKQDYWNSLGEETPEIEIFENDDDCYGRYFFTNGIEKINRFFSTCLLADGEWWAPDEKKGTYPLDDDLSLKPYFWDHRKVRLLDSDKNLLCDIVFTDDWDMKLEKNQTEFDLRKTTDYRLVILPKAYSDSLREVDNLDENQVLGEIQAFQVNQKEDACFVKLLIFKDFGDDFDRVYSFFSAFCYAYPILFHRHKEAFRASMSMVLAHSISR